MKSASLIGKTKDGLYLIQARTVHNPNFEPGKYPFTFPGACSLFGGDLEENENYIEGFKREISEEVPGLKIGEIKHKSYKWKEQLDEVYNKLNNKFHENLPAFLGFQLDEKIPQEALGKNRGKELTYREWIEEHEEDNYFITILNAEDLKKIKLNEGKKILLLPAEAIISLVMVPTDKLAILDEIVNSGNY